MNQYVERKDGKMPRADLEKLLSRTINKKQKNRNRMSIPEYFLFIYLSAVLVGYCFFDMILCRLPILFTQHTLTWKQSVFLSIAMIAVCVLFGFLLTYSHCRNVSTGAIVILLPFSILSVPVLYRAYPILSMISGIGIILSIVIFFVSLAKCRKTSPKAMPLCSAMGIVGIVFIAFITTHFFPLNYIPKNDVQINTNGTSLIASNIDKLKKLDESTFRTLTLDERMEVLQCVAGIESEYFGFPEVPKLSAQQMGHDIKAYYKDSENHIYFNFDDIQSENSRNCLETLLHEIYHCWQKNIITAYQSTDDTYKSLRIYTLAREYSQYSDNYAQSGIDYYTQAFETDARIYAEDAAKEYFDKIENFQEEQNGTGM